MPIYLDPSAGSPSVIEIGGACYSLVGPSSNAPDTSGYDTDYSDCDTCLCCDLDTASFSGTLTAVTWCNSCPGQSNGTSSLSFSGSGSYDGVFSSNLPSGDPIRDPTYTCTNPAGYAWGAYCTVTCNYDGTFSTTLSVNDGCGTYFSAPGSGTLTCDEGVLTGTVMASGNDNHGNPVSVTFTFG